MVVEQQETVGEDESVAQDEHESRAQDAPRARSQPAQRKRARSRSGASSRARRGRAGRDASPRGSIGEAIYEEVNRLVESEGLNKQAAFARVGAAQGRQVGTVSANYYRVARAHGRGRAAQVGSVQQRRRARGRGARAANTGIEAAIGDFRSAVEALLRVVREQERAIVKLQEENAQLDAIRALVAGASTNRGRRRRGR
jgi:hypothetical protein